MVAESWLSIATFVICEGGGMLELDIIGAWDARAVNLDQEEADRNVIQAVRGGSIVGEHDVIFAGKDEVVTFSHTAYSKAIFAKGAIQAAKFLAGKEPGLYTMADVIG